MRIAFVGKGGSGKTTLSALFTRHLVAGMAAEKTAVRGAELLADLSGRQSRCA
ncbi:MAG: hypothetical protein M3R63_00835 [Actinomycetota bacterium]|nr:hypothetical protein [Actinomycetota bacterium]